MANVFLGDDLLLERAVAIKLLHPELAVDSSGMERFRREAMTLAVVRSPHVVGIYDIGLDEEGVYLVMQYIEGHTIEQEIARTGAMTPARAETILTQLLDGLAEVHAQGLVHRDIKPSNILLEGDDHVVLLDLGIVLDARRNPLTAPGMVAGTPGYLPPESRTRAESDYSSDVYQVGLLMLLLFTGVDYARRCPISDFEDLMEKLPPAFGAVARRALAIEPSARFPSAEVMKEALIGLAGSAPPERLPNEPFRLTVPVQVTAARTIKTTALQAAQILSAQIVSARTDDEEPATLRIVSRRPRTRMPLLKAPKRGRILILDDDMAFCGTLDRMLKGMHDVLVVKTPRQALAHIEGGARADAITLWPHDPDDVSRCGREAVSRASRNDHLSDQRGCDQGGADLRGQGGEQEPQEAIRTRIS